MKLLIAEDDKYILEGLQDLLHAEGYDTVAAADGQSAIDLFRSEAPHFVLLDIMMPKLDGYAVCREIRKRDNNIPVIFISAKSEEIDRHTQHFTDSDLAGEKFMIFFFHPPF